MKAIKITQNNQVNFKNKTVGSWYIGQIPKVFIVGNEQIFGYDSREDLHPSHGWKDFVQEPIGENQKRTNEIIESENTVTYEVVDMTEEEILDKTLNEAESQRQLRLQSEQIKIVEDKFQEIETVEDILDNEDAYPLWRNFEDGFNFHLDFKLRDFNAENELKVYKVIQPHNKQSNWFPRNVPALFVLVQEDGATEWEAGAQYIVGDVRTYLGIEYRCLQAHTSQIGWQPPNVPSLWTLN